MKTCMRCGRDLAVSPVEAAKVLKAAIWEINHHGQHGNAHDRFVALEPDLPCLLGTCDGK